jgi:RimJ/RimL family protein N-acetyltransferase
MPGAFRRGSAPVRACLLIPRTSIGTFPFFEWLEWLEWPRPSRSVDDSKFDACHAAMNDAELLGCGAGQVDDSFFVTEWPAVGDPHSDRAVGVETRDRDPRAERQSPMGGRHLARVEALTACRAMARELGAVPRRVAHEHFGSRRPRPGLGQRFLMGRRLARVFQGVAARAGSPGRDAKCEDGERTEGGVLHVQRMVALRGDTRLSQRICEGRLPAYRQANFLQGPHVPFFLRTNRLVLRPWRDADLEPFAALNADPRVMQHFARALSRDESDARAATYTGEIEKHGFSFWAIEAPGVAPFIGFVGLRAAAFDAPFCPCIEIGWRLAFDAWGHGYATEAGRAALEYGFTDLGLSEILAWTVPANLRSQAVMVRLGMRRSAHEDFDHPKVPEGNPLRHHVLYRLTRHRTPITESPSAGG